MKLARSWTLTLIITFGAILWMASGVFITDDDHENTLRGDGASVPPLNVRVEPSVAESMTNRLILQGQTLAKRKVTVRAETGGVVTDVLLKRGDKVKLGASLIRLALEDREARLTEATSLLEERQVQYQAAQSLKQSGFQAETEMAHAKAALDAAKSIVKLAELELDRINVKAPIPGILNSRLVEVGDFVARGDPLATVVDLDPIRVVGLVSERYLGQVQVGKAGEVRLLDNTQVKATVTYVGSVASESTRTFPVEMEIANPQGKIIEGITAELHLPIKEVLAHKIAPSALSLLDDGTLSVKAIDEASVVVAHPVRILGDSSDGIWLGDLPPNLSVITVGHEFVKPGEKVTAVTHSP